jgi:DNA-directed RNA polymerase subunit RPC12/RpoP
MITCKECEAEFTITHDSVSEPEYCPFCAFKINYDEEDEYIDEEEDWRDDP